MRTITKEEAIALHRQMWNQIADMLEAGEKIGFVGTCKQEALDRLGIPRNERPELNCYCCEYNKQNKVDNVCGKCPLNWTGAEHAWEDSCGFDEAPYQQFCIALNREDYDKATKLAREIANLPERKEEV